MALGLDKMERRWIFVAVLFMLLCLCVFGGLYAWQNADMVYTGTVIFNSREEYETLLNFVAQDEVDYRVLEAYPDTWTTPMTVEYSLVVPKNMAFPYGGVGVQERDSLFGVAIPAGVFLCLGLVAWGWVYRVK